MLEVESYGFKRKGVALSVYVCVCVKVLTSVCVCRRVIGAKSRRLFSMPISADKGCTSTEEHVEIYSPNIHVYAPLNQQVG